MTMKQIETLDFTVESLGWLLLGNSPVKVKPNVPQSPVNPMTSRVVSLGDSRLGLFKDFDDSGKKVLR